MKIRELSVAGLAVATLLTIGCADEPQQKAVYAPQVLPKDFVAKVDHPYFPLVPGTTYTYQQTEHGRVSDEVVTVTADTKTILGVSCVVVHDVLTTAGVVAEDTFDWYAQDVKGNVWYFGEATKEFKPDGSADTEGSWEAGVNGAQPGVIMPANPQPDWPYHQEYLKGIAEDMGQVVAVDTIVKTPAGEYHGCVRTREWSPLEGGHESKWYAKGIGFVRSESTGGEVVELVEVSKP